MLRSDPTQPRHRLLLATATALGALALPGTAGAMTATAPVHNAATPSHPVFHWTLAAGEQTDTIEISNSAATAPAGDFFAEHLVDGDGFFAPTTTWAPTRPLYAGTYWWHVTGHDAAYNDIRTRPEAFHVAPVITGGRFSLAKYSWSRNLDITARWTTNAPTVLVTVRVSRNGRTIWKRSSRAATLVAMDPDTAYLTWTNNRRKAKRGQKVRVTMTIAAAGRSVSTTRTVKAP